MPRIVDGPPRTSYWAGHFDIALPTASIPSLAIALVPNTSAPCLISGVRWSPSDAGPTTNSRAGSPAVGVIALATRVGALARCINGHVSSDSRRT